MFGYIMPLKAELKVREWDDYRAYYCGLCKELKREYGFLPRFMLNYDFVLPALICDALANELPCCHNERCMANPLVKRCIYAKTRGLSFAADSLILTCYYKLADDITDERGIKRLLARLLKYIMRKKWRKAAAHLPDVDSVLAAETQNGHATETRGCCNVDEAADATAKMTAAMFAAIAPEAAYSKALTRFGLCMGKLIYYLDAAEDYEDDQKHNKYNVFINMGLSRNDTVNEAKRMCNMCAGEMALCYNLLDIQADKPLLDNIIFLGLQESILHAGVKKEKEKDKD